MRKEILFYFENLYKVLILQIKLFRKFWEKIFSDFFFQPLDILRKFEKTSCFSLFSEIDVLQADDTVEHRIFLWYNLYNYILSGE